MFSSHSSCATVLARAALASIGLAACGDSAERADPSLDRPLELTWVRTVLQPDTLEATAWVGRLTQLLHDPRTGHLLALDRDDQRIVEFTIDGQFLGSFGRRGGGPGELDNLFAFGASADHVTALDNGNGKLVIFGRVSHETATEIRLGRAVRDITTVGDTLIAVLPGPEGSLFELFHSDGRRLGSFGDGGFLGGWCSGCSITYIGDGLLVVVKPAVPEGRIYRLDGTMLEAFAFTELAPVLTRWREDFLEKIRQASRMVAVGAEGRIAAGKLWVGKPSPLNGGSFLMSAHPENMDRNPSELWELDYRGRVTKRYIFAHTWLGSPTVSSAHIYTISRDGRFAIDEHLLPGGAGEH
ncbi:hypothetical protein [Candidatus Palauibacter sp.]|uniref:hypothetical protein n=1 Tax=Candidatus Palauibacter sp. TaxID=3101350 RepID=UPI003B5CAFA0